MANDYAIRQGLLNKGVANNDIGYDEGSGYVQVKGQNFLKPELNVQGSTYTNQGNFDSAWNKYNQNQAAQADPMFHMNNAQPTTAAQPAAQPKSGNPYVDQFQQMIADIHQRLSAPQVDPYSTPQYAAAQARAQQGAQQGIRAAQEAFGSSGFGRSTALGNAAQHEQNNANQYLMTQVVPQIQQQLQAQRQAEIANQFNLLNPVLSLLNRDDTQTQQGRANARADAALTGNYLPQDARDIINQILGMKQQAEGGNVSDEQMAGFRTQADALRNQLATMGVDPNIVGYESDYNQALQNVAKGNPTLQGQEAQRAAKTFEQQYEAGKIDLETRNINLQQLKDPNSPINRKNQIDLQIAEIDLANLPEENRLKLEQLRKTIAQIGAAPYRSQDEVEMDKVKLETAREELNQLKSGANKKATPEKTKTATDYKLNPSFGEDVQYFKNNPNEKALLDTNPQDFINEYGYDGYQALRKAAGLDK